MNREEIIRMAREAGMIGTGEAGNELERLYREAILDALPRFAALVAAAVEERLKWDGLHSCYSECDRPACVHTRKAVEAEREACAKVCEAEAKERYHMEVWGDDFANGLAAAIRARGQ